MLGNRKQIFVAVVTLVGSIVVASGPAGSADGHRDKERLAGKRHQGHPAGKGMPARFVAETGGRIVVVSVATGQVERHLTAERPGGGAADPALSPDGRTVWFSRGDGQCAAHLAFVPTGGGQERRVPGSGEAGAEERPAPRPGHAQLAFSRTDCREPAESLVVGDPDGLEGYGQTGFAPMEWSRDGKHLLASASAGGAVHLLTVSKHGAIVENTVLDPPPPSDECRLAVVGFSPDDNGGYVGVRRCGRPGENARRSLVLLDTQGKIRRVVVRLPRGLDFVDRISFDRSGHSLLYSTLPSELNGSSGSSDPEPTLWVWRDGSKAQKVMRSSPYRHPTWLP